MNEIIEAISISTGLSGSVVIAAAVVLSLWSLLWKGWALWVAALRKEKWWFIVLLLVNTLGILEIVYLFALGKRKK